MALARNIGLNLVGQGAPLIAAAICIPLLIRHLGTERFGVLTIAWMVIGYFSLFDLGLGRALTRSVAEKLAKHEVSEIPALVWTSLALMAVLGGIAGLGIALSRTQLAVQVLKVPPAFVDETTGAFLLLAVSVPFVILTTGLRGILEAYQRFDMVNLVRVPMGVWTFAGPLLIVPWSVRLDAVVALLVAGRLATTAWHAWLVNRAVPDIRQNMHIDSRLVKPLLRFGGWMTVSNVISPMMVYMDRFFISAIVGLSAVAYYTTPYEVVFRINVIPEAIFGVLFPLMTAQLASSGTKGDALFSSGIKMMAATMFPAALVVVVLAGPFLNWWLGEAFQKQSTVVMQLLMLGLFINSMAKVPYNLVQAKGRADLTAKIHMLELPLYVLGLVMALRQFGIQGAALLWAARMALDFALLAWAAKHTVNLQATRGPVALVLVLTAVIAMASLVKMPLTNSLVALGAALACYAVIFYKLILSNPERLSLRHAVASRITAKNG